MLDFLFASQDASTASLCWTLTLMADHPDVLEKVGETFFWLKYCYFVRDGELLAHVCRGRTPQLMAGRPDVLEKVSVCLFRAAGVVMCVLVRVGGRGWARRGGTGQGKAEQHGAGPGRKPVHI